MLDALPPPPSPQIPPAIIVRSAEDRAPLILLGLVNFGTRADLERLEAAARAQGFFTGWPETQEAPAELMVLFRAGTSAEQAFTLYRAARRGDYGSLRVELIVVTPGLAQDGIDVQTDLSIVTPEAIIEPERR